jgi:hypothetical protein
MENQWSYKNCQIKDGQKPGSRHFQYYYVVSEGAQKKCNYCVWIVNEALSRFDESKDFNAIASAQREAWNRWVKEKIDAEDFKNKVLKYEKDGEKEIELSEMAETLSMD